MKRNKLFLAMLFLFGFSASAVANTLVQGGHVSDSIKLYHQANLYRLEFTPSKGAGLAVISHESRFLFLFDKKFDAKKPSQDVINDLFIRFNTIEGEDYTLIEVEPRPGVSFEIMKTDQGWQLEMAYQVPGKKKEDNVSPERGLELSKSDWPKGEVQGVEAERIIYFEFEGVNYAAAPSYRIDGGLRLNFESPFYNLAHTLQGLCFQVYSEKILLFLEDGHLKFENKFRIELEQEEPDLKILEQIQYSPLKRDLPQNNLPASIRDFEVTLPKGPTQFLPHFQIQRTLIHLNNKNGTSAQSTLNSLIRAYPGLGYHPLFKFLTGIGQFLQNEYRISLDYFPFLGRSDEVAFWHYLSTSKLRERGVFGNPALDFSKVALLDYAKNLALEVFGVTLELAYTNHDYNVMRSLLEPQSHLQGDLYHALYTFYSAQLNQYEGRNEEALKQLRGLEGPFVPLKIYVQARLKIIMSEYELGNINREQLIKELEMLSMRWRGDYLEYHILRKIVELQEEAKA